MKEWCQSFVLAVVFISSFVHATSHEVDHSIFVDSIAYEYKGYELAANITLSNGCRFIFIPGIESEYLFDRFQEELYPGKEVFIDLILYQPQFALMFDAGDGEYRYYCVGMGAGIKSIVPVIEKIEKVWMGCFSYRYEILLSDGTVWHCKIDNSTKTWKVGQKVVVSKSPQVEKGRLLLLNMDANHLEYYRSFGSFEYFDRRVAIGKPIYP